MGSHEVISGPFEHLVQPEIVNFLLFKMNLLTKQFKVWHRFQTCIPGIKINLIGVIQELFASNTHHSSFVLKDDSNTHHSNCPAFS